MFRPNYYLWFSPINVTQTITVDDTTPPTASNPVPIFVECPEDIPGPNILDVIDESDNCGVLNVTWTQDQINNAQCPIINRIYTITDLCGNTSQVTQVITVTDNQNPTFMVDDTLYIQGSVIPPVDLGVIYNVNDNCSALPLVSFISESSYGFCPRFINRKYRIMDNCGNFVDTTFTIVVDDVNNQVQANFSFTPTNITPLNSTINFLNSSINAENYQWIFELNQTSTQFEPSYEFNPENCDGYSVMLIATRENCIDTAVNVIPCFDETIFYVPNTFTPDGDEFNNTFYPVFYSGFDPYNFEMLIFNRWGELIFETHDTEIGWNGSYGNEKIKVQSGVYTWKITYKNKQTDERKEVVGHVTILR